MGRLGEGNRAFVILTFLLSPERIYHNLFAAHPPFHIDGTFGAVSRIAEMLAQGDAGEIRLLPARPERQRPLIAAAVTRRLGG